MKAWAKDALIAVLAVFAPAKPMALTVLVLVVADLALGLMGARKRRRKIKSSGIKLTIMKLLIYETALLLAYLVGTYLTGPLIPTLNIVSSIIGLTELKSVLEHLDELGGGKVIHKAVRRLGKYASFKESGDE